MRSGNLQPPLSLWGPTLVIVTDCSFQLCFPCLIVEKIVSRQAIKTQWVNCLHLKGLPGVLPRGNWPPPHLTTRTFIASNGEYIEPQRAQWPYSASPCSAKLPGMRHPKWDQPTWLRKSFFKKTQNLGTTSSKGSPAHSGSSYIPPWVSNDFSWLSS